MPLFPLPDEMGTIFQTCVYKKTRKYVVTNANAKLTRQLPG
ncbi:hypothetical protein CSC12_0998 [Klebsiella michiganensis]|nr:hypothetical protein CSC12_0998 [Klebsiella michiganensis]